MILIVHSMFDYYFKGWLNIISRSIAFYLALHWTTIWKYQQPLIMPWSLIHFCSGHVSRKHAQQEVHQKRAILCFRVEHHSFSIVLMDDPMVENDCFNFSLASRHRYFHLFSIWWPNFTSFNIQKIKRIQKWNSSMSTHFQ